MFSRDLESGYHSSTSTSSLTLSGQGKQSLNQSPMCKFYFISEGVLLIISFKSKGRHILYMLHLSKHNVIAGGSCSQVGIKYGKSLLWCAASSKGTEHHLELIFSCQIISAKGKETRESKPQPPAPTIADTSVPPCKPGLTLIFTLTVQTLCSSGVYLGEVSQWVPSPQVVASRQRQQRLQLWHPCTAHWFSFLNTCALAPAALSSSSFCPDSFWDGQTSSRQDK